MLQSPREIVAFRVECLAKEGSVNLANGIPQSGPRRKLLRLTDLEFKQLVHRLGSGRVSKICCVGFKVIHILQVGLVALPVP